MIYQILNGDSLAHHFADTKIEGEVIVMRECLIEGNLQGKTMIDFWKTRAEYLSDTYHQPAADYFKNVVGELEKITDADTHSEFNLWFEFDLFCQVNMWFLLSFIRATPAEKKVYVVYSSYLNKEDKNFWSGFGRANSEVLNSCYQNKISLSEANLQHGSDLWWAYQNADFNRLKSLSQNQSACFPHTEEVVDAHIARFPRNNLKGRPEQVLEKIMSGGSTDFYEVFQKFQDTERIYGFGDAQVRQLYDKISSKA